jgi:uncharacterized protein (DUF1697 family)
MPRYIAFLHAVNVGGRLVANATLREQFEAMGYTNVRTFISTGNVVFETPARATPALVRAIEKDLESALHMHIDTFVRSEAEVQAIVRHKAYDFDTLHAAKEMHIGFLTDPLPSDAIQRLMALRTPLDQFHVNHREIYWLCRSRRNASDFSAEVFAKALRVPVTFRPLATLLRLLPWIESGRPSASRLAKKAQPSSGA